MTLNIEQQEASANGCRIALTGKEFAILQLLMLRKNMILTKEMILSQLYGGMDEPEIKIIDVFICKIRRSSPRQACVTLSAPFGAVATSFATSAGTMNPLRS